jgi:phosphate transport system protein
MTTEHTVKSFDAQLRELSGRIVQMGGLAEAQLAMALDALARRDGEAAALVVKHDRRIDDLEQEVDDAAVRLLALRQPMASDLREVLAALKMSSDLERIGDYSANVAKRVQALTQAPPMEPARSVPRMGRLVQQGIKDVLDAYVERDVERARDMWERDAEVDEMYTSIFRELLTYMMEDPRNISPCTHLLFIAKNIERIGDHATNIAEMVHFLITGEPLRDGRPKGDRSSFAVIEPSADPAAEDAEDTEAERHA